MRGKILLIAALIISIFSFTACSETEVKENDNNDLAMEAEEKKLQIGMSFDSFVIERWERDRDVFVSAAKESGADVYVQVADGDLNEQIEQIRYFIDKGVDAIVIIAVDCNGLSDVVDQAKAAGITVVSYDRLILNADIDLLVTFDNYKVGQLMGQTMVKNVRSMGKIVCINGSESDYNVTEVRQGFLDEINKSTLSVVYTDFCPNWEAEYAYNVMQKLLDDGLHPHGIMCGNDDIATVVYNALSERGMASGLCLVGQDADLAACQRIVNGWQDMTVYKPVESLARVAAKNTISLLVEGKADVTKAVDNGYKEVPAILLDPVAVDESNMKGVIIDGGFHAYDAVYGQ